MILVNYVILIFFMLVAVAFITMFERKILGYIQNRKSVNKVGVLGLLQPLSDGLKLLMKESSKLEKSNFLIYFMSPLMNFFFGSLLYVLLPFSSMMDWFNLALLFFLSVLSLNVFSVILMGWSSNSGYSFLSSVRMVAQLISYEISLMILLLSLMVSVESFSLMGYSEIQVYMWLVSIYVMEFIIMFIVFLAESNRIPFDFIEGESELVSGFNIEYGSGYFAFIFIAEYMSLLLMCFLLSLFFLGGDLLSWIFYVKLMLVIYMCMLTRGVFPRFRYDKLMMMAWKVFLPIVLSLMGFYFSVMILVKNMFF